MTLPANDDFANRALSIEELEAIAAGWPSWVHDVVHFVKNEASAVAHWIEGPGLKILEKILTPGPGPHTPPHLPF